jgi:hypothetical protein
MGNIIIEAAACIWMAMICWVHAAWFVNNIKTGPWFHAVFGAVYAVPVIWIGWFWRHDLVLIVALVTERFVVYNPMLNLIRDKPFFYLSVNNDHPSWWDELEMKYNHLYPFVWIASLILFVLIQFKFI